MKVIACGSRHWTNGPSILEVLERFRPFASQVILLHGGARGADALAAYFAQHMGMGVVAYPADWEAHGRAAGPIRNQRMLDENPDVELVLGFTPDPPGKPGSGTWDMLRRAHDKHIPYLVRSQ